MWRSKLERVPDICNPKLFLSGSLPCLLLPLPPIIFHAKAGHWIDFFLLEYKTLALIPAPGFFVLPHATQMNLVRQMLPGEGKQSAAETAPVIFGPHKQLVEIFFWQMQREHCSDRAALMRDEQAPALLDLEHNARTQFCQQKIAGIFEPDRNPALHPYPGDLVMFVGSGRAYRDRHEVALTALRSLNELHATAMRRFRAADARFGGQQKGRLKSRPPLFQCELSLLAGGFARRRLGLLSRLQIFTGRL